MRLRMLAIVAAIVVLPGCMSPSDETATTPSPSSPSSTTAPPPPQPEWDFTLPALPPVAEGPANRWVRGGDLGEDWTIGSGAGEGRFQLVWWISDSDRDPRPGSACGASLGTKTDFDVVDHAVRTAHKGLVGPDASALLSLSTRDNSTSCGSKQHISIAADGTASTTRGPYDGPVPFTVAANGSLWVEEARLWLGPGETAVLRTDRWENETGPATHDTGGPRLQPPRATSVHHTALTRVVHLGSWAADRIWVVPDVCSGPAEPPSGNCVDRGSGP
ncbi:MAG TPA: hypothetical protein VM327_00785 [Candidatus Thermoplasmatota archaeon]|nr:hypothetical protein [Candidatus Thermoplasmatota archaeon]